MKKILIIFLHVFIGWALCGAIMGIGPKFMSMGLTLIVHLLAAPIFFAVISLIYYKKFNYTSPLQTAVIFTSFIILVDFFIVALLILKNLDMFASIIGTWLPFALIFLSSYLTGLGVNKTGGS